LYDSGTPSKHCDEEDKLKKVFGNISENRVTGKLDLTQTAWLQ